jgi:hypothetical protein
MMVVLMLACVAMNLTTLLAIKQSMVVKGGRNGQYKCFRKNTSTIVFQGSFKRHAFHCHIHD